MVGPPVRDGAVLIAEDGRIAAVGKAAEVPSPAGTTRRDGVGEVLLPGLINTHTHLELTGLAGQVDHDDFPSWIRQLRRVKEGRRFGEFLAAAREGVRRMLRAGVTTVADTGDSGAVLRALHEEGASGIAYQEVFGPDPARLEESIGELQDRVAEQQRYRSPRARLGVSPHAPYSVSGPLFRAVADFARRCRLPLAVHIAESQAESLLLQSGTGPFADSWRGRGIPLPSHPAHDPPAGGIGSPVEWLDWFGVLGPATLCIHAVRLGPADIELLRRRGAGVAHCPLSNRRHEHGDAPLGALRDAGVPVGVGTDSEVSVGDLDLFAEARAARALAGLDAAAALDLMTRGAARAIGFPEALGVLAPGAWGDVIAVTLAAPLGAQDVAEAVLEAGHSAVAETWIGGRPALGPS